MQQKYLVVSSKNICSHKKYLHVQWWAPRRRRRCRGPRWSSGRRSPASARRGTPAAPRPSTTATGASAVELPQRDFTKFHSAHRLVESAYYRYSITSAVARASPPSSTWRGTSTCTATSPGSRGSPYRYADILSCHWSIMWHIAIARILSSDWSVLANVTQSWLKVLEYYNLIGQNTKWWGYSNLIGQCSSDQDTVIWLVNVLEYCHLIGHLSMSRARPPPRPLPRSRTADSTNSSSLSTIKWALDLK